MYVHVVAVLHLLESPAGLRFYEPSYEPCTLQAVLIRLCVCNTIEPVLVSLLCIVLNSLLCVHCLHYALWVLRGKSEGGLFKRWGPVDEI